MIDISVYGTTYQLVGYLIHQQNYFTSVVYWKGKQHYYDEMKAQDKQLLPFNERRHLKRSMGSLWAVQLHYTAAVQQCKIQVATN